MSARPLITRSASLEMLWRMRGKFGRDAEIRELHGDPLFAGISLKLVNLIDRELQARGVLPRENGGPNG